jgi:hypothetical protein
MINKRKCELFSLNACVARSGSPHNTFYPQRAKHAKNAACAGARVDSLGLAKYDLLALLHCGKTVLGIGLNKWLNFFG